MNTFLRFLAIVAAVLIVVSCSSSDPVQLGDLPIYRQQQGFDVTAEPLFGESAGDKGTDGDVSAIIVGPRSANRGEVWEHDGTRWSVSSALITAQPGGETSGSFRFLGQGTGSTDISNPIPFGLPGETILCPHVSAAYFYHEHYPDNLAFTFVEVVIVYQWWNAANSTYDVVCERQTFDPDDFVTGEIDDIEPTRPPQYFFEQWDVDCIQPDVVHDPEHGYIYIVHSMYENPGSTRVYLWRILRDAYYLGWFHTEGRRCVSGYGRNAFNARIDAGWVDPVYPFNNPQLFMACTYMCGGSPGFRVWVNYWLEGYPPDPDDDFMVLVPDPELQDYAAGLPCIDIGPPDANFAAIAWTQAKSEAWQDHVSVAYMDCRGGWSVFHPIGEPDDRFSCCPSVAVHHDSPPGNAFRSSVSYYYKDPDTGGWWNPRACWIDTFVDNYGNAIGTQVDNWPETVSNSAHGVWMPLAAYEHDYGANTGLVVFDDPNDLYWMVWSSQGESQGEPWFVYGAYGFTE